MGTVSKESGNPLYEVCYIRTILKILLMVYSTLRIVHLITETQLMNSDVYSKSNGGVFTNISLLTCSSEELHRLKIIFSEA